MVESVNPASVAKVYGFEPGDLLLSWSFQPRDPSVGQPQTGTLETVFDLVDLFFEKVPRGELTLNGWRQGRPFSWSLRSTGSLYLGLQARPVMDLDHWERYYGLLGKIQDEKQPPDFVDAVPASSPRLAAWYRLRYAEAAASAGCMEAADRAFEEAAEILARASDPSAQAELLRTWAGQLVEHEETARALGLDGEALALERQREGGSLAGAFTHVSLAYFSDREGDLARAEREWLAALALEEKLVPEGLEVAVALNMLGYLTLWRGDAATAQERLKRSEAIQLPIATNTYLYASTLTKLALVAQNLGDLERAEALQRQALALNEKLVPGSLDHGGALMNLATTLLMRGELASAEDVLRQSMELFDKPGVDPWSASEPRVVLGELALYRGDLAAAQSYLELALGPLQEGPKSVELAGVYSELALVARKQQRFADARAWEKSALAITERLVPGDLGRAGRLQALARIEQEGGDLAAAETLLRQAEATVRKMAPEGPGVNSILRDLGKLLAQRGRPAKAEALYQRILSTLERRGLTGTKDEAEIRNLLGSVQRREGNLKAAEESFCRATEILDVQRSHLGGSLESRSWFESETQSYSFDCLSALMALGRSAEAFHALEHGKTRVFLQLLAERDLRLLELPPELKTERSRLDAEYDRVLSQLSQLAAGASEIASLRSRLEEIKAAREALIARLRGQSPRLAALQAPASLDLAEARRALDPGTTLLAYAVGPEGSYLFVVDPSGEGGHGLEVHRLPMGRAALEKEIEAYRRLLTNPRSDLGELNARAARLYDRLLRPAGKSLARSRRILISADGPLHVLPWAALRRHSQYLAQWRPIHVTASATVYDETRRGRRPVSDPGSWRLVAFGDPKYPGPSRDTRVDSEVQSAVRSGLNLRPLPASRTETQEIAKLFPRAEVYLGEEATEEHAKTAASRADLLHFATHGLLDARFPLDSSLALTIPAQLQEGRDNGLLQAWEIFESLRLDANLVTLSACETALGSEMGGEGLLGLTRAFQFAGARSVLGSLWNVSDVSTALLMKSFYTYLRQGRTKDEALQAAQLDLIRSKKGTLSHPYHWAGFSLYGDWR
ncbi:MAG TPA: CHAT domain-containing protein [Thermoanaerobaculia bacterium]|nr:CHAT domain-containing protein [Thermoanaerobaculia bacterium]